MDARSGKIALAVAVLAGGVLWLASAGCSTDDYGTPCNLNCAPTALCCNHAYAFDTPLPDGGPAPIPDGGYLPGVQFPACLHADANGAGRLPNEQLGGCADQY